jgi:hypothetical protein
VQQQREKAMKALLTVGAFLAALALVACHGYRTEGPKIRLDDWTFLATDSAAVLEAQR